VTYKGLAGSWCKAEERPRVLSKTLLAILLFMLASKLGLKTKLRELKPKIDRAVNITIVVVVTAYVGQLLWAILRKPGGN
jgi:hypothetical protein